MPTLLLLRHAKSDWGDASLGDFERPLSARGLKAAPRMGEEIARRGWAPDLAFVSTAARARQTWSQVSAQLGIPDAGNETVDVKFERSLYLASPQHIMSLLTGAPPETEIAIVIGHNPGIAMLAHSLAARDSDDEALLLMAAKYPTAALARYELAGRWTDLAVGTARMTHFLRPRDLD